MFALTMKAALGAAGGTPAHAPPHPTMQIVFSYLRMNELVAVALTCREWKRLLEHRTPCLGFGVSTKLLQHGITPVHIAQSVFKSHIRSLRLHTDCTPAVMRTLGEMKELMFLQRCVLRLHPGCRAIYTFPPKLKTLSLDIWVHVAQDPLLNMVKQLNTCFELLANSSPHIKSLSLVLRFACFDSIMDGMAARIQFLPLLQLKHMHRFQIDFVNYNIPTQCSVPSLMQMIRTHPSLTNLSLFACFRGSPDLSHDIFHHLVEPTPPVHLTNISLQKTTLDARKIECLQKIPTLTNIAPSVFDVPSFDFMSAFTRCTTFCCSTGVSLSVIFRGLQLMPQLTSLTISNSDVTSEALPNILSHLPRLSTLGLTDCENLTDMQWMKRLPPLPCITKLNITQCENISLAEIVELVHMPLLNTLSIIDSFDAPMDALTVKLLTVPSLLLPKLRTSTCRQEQFM